MRLTDAMQSTFSKTGTRTVAAASGLIRVSLNRPMGNVFSRHAPTSARTRAHRSAFSSESGSTSAWPLVPRRRPPRATPSISERTAPGDQSRSSPLDGRVNGSSFHDPKYLPSPGSPKALRSPDRLTPWGLLSTPLHPPWLAPLWAELGALPAAATTRRVIERDLA
jgi:hypothetical protein